MDRKRADRTLSPDEVEGAFREQTVEVTATREQPVVSKQARVVEEVSVGKSQHEREEVVRDKVRRTRLDVEQEGVKQDMDGYKDKLKPDWRRHTLEEAEALMAETGLSGPFWNLRG